MDWSAVQTLLDVVHKAPGLGPNFAWLADAATAELKAMKPVQVVPVPTPADPEQEDLDLAAPAEKQGITIVDRRL